MVSKTEVECESGAIEFDGPTKEAGSFVMSIEGQEDKPRKGSYSARGIGVAWKTYGGEWTVRQCSRNVLKGAWEMRDGSGTYRSGHFRATRGHSGDMRDG